MQFSDNGCKFIERWEGKRLVPYKDTAGLLTIGIGHLIKAGEHFTELTEQQCYDLLRKDLSTAVKAVNKYVSVHLTQNEFDALVSLVFNISGNNFINSSLLKLLNEENYGKAADSFLSWNKITIKGKKQECKGLTNRRKAERELFLETDA